MCKDPDPLLAHPVSPCAIQLGMDETLWVLHVYGTLEESVDNYHQGYHHKSTNNARRKLAALGHERRLPEVVCKRVEALMQQRHD